MNKILLALLIPTICMGCSETDKTVSGIQPTHIPQAEEVVTQSVGQNDRRGQEQGQGQRGQGKHNGQSGGNHGNGKKGQQNQMPISVQGELTGQEIEDLLFLQEEEKLARDTYLYAFEKYGKRIFSNISSSEETHMNRLSSLLDAYKIKNTLPTEAGVFKNEELQKIYNDLTQKIDISLGEALLVGATVEDLDIKDIENLLKNTKNESVIKVYNNLMCGSTNHLRSFYSQALSEGKTYTPGYISEERFTEIIDGSHQKCGQM